MSFLTDFTEKLLAVRTSLADNTQINDPENYSKLTGLLNYLHSPLNPKTIDAVMRQGSADGKFRPVDIRYQPQWGDEDVVTDDANSTCDTTNQRRDKIATYEPTLFVSSKFTLDEDYLRLNTEDFDSPDNRLARNFQKAMRVGREKMNALLGAKLATLVGANPAAGAGAGSYTDIEMINADGSLSVDSFDTIYNHMEDNYMGGTPSIVGMGNARKVFNRLAVGNLNTSAGIDFAEISEQFNSVLFKDQFIEAELGAANRVAVCYPGLQQFYHYNLNNGFFAQNVADLRIKGTMPDPVYPFSWDYIMEYDNNCENGNGLQGAWTIRVYSYFDMFTVPEDAFGDVYGDLNDFNGVVGYRITQGS